MKTKTGERYYKTHLLGIDAWNDGEDGWTWNNWHKLESEIFFAESRLGSARAILSWFRKAGYLSDASKGKCAIEDDGYNVVVSLRSTGKPLYALCYGEYLD